MMFRAGRSRRPNLWSAHSSPLAKRTNTTLFSGTTEERARERAKSVDEAIKNGQPVGKLAGVPFIAKDNFLAFGAQTTAASNMLGGFDAPYQALR